MSTPHFSNQINLDGLQRVFNAGCVFSFETLSSHPHELHELLDYCESGNAIRGRGEFLLTTIPGAAYSKIRGDVWVPGIGFVEVKSASGKSRAKLSSQRLGSRGSLGALIERCEEICGAHIVSFGYRNLKAFFASAVDTDAHGTAIASCINHMFPLCGRASDLILRKGFVRRLRAASSAANFSEMVDDEILHGLLEFSFDYYKAIDEFDTLLLLNGPKGVFISRGYELIDLVKSHVVKMEPSALNFTSPRTSSIGISLY